MKPNLLFVALSLVFASPVVSAKTEIEILRSKCAEQERQIQQLERENSRLRNMPPTSQSVATTHSPSSTKPEPAATPASETATNNTYTVKAGDSLAKIARTVGMTPTSLARQNGLKTDAVIHPGQKLKIRSSTPAPASVAAAAQAPAASASASEAGKTYTIKAGETYSSISRKLKIPVSTLISANPKVKPTAIRAGQVINLSVSKPAATVASAAPAPKPAALVTPPPSPVIQSERPHTKPLVEVPAPQVQAAPAPAPVAENTKAIRPVTIDGEMTYGDFATKYGTDAERLNSLNGLDLNNATVLAKGSELYVPTAQ